jgi:hypothetical protein
MPAKTVKPDEWISVKQACAASSLADSTIRGLARSGVLRSAKLLRRRVISRTSLNDLIAQGETQPREKSPFAA